MTDNNIKVAVRVRPLISRETNDGAEIRWHVKDGKIIYEIEPRTQKQLVGTNIYTFDRIFTEYDTNWTVYADVVQPIVAAAMQGFNGTIFAYGQTSSGKTFTIMGDLKSEDNENIGLIPNAVIEIFDTISNLPDREFLLRISYMEIYQETINDLLSNKRNLKIKESPTGEVYVDQLKEEIVSSMEQILELIEQGEENRHYGETNMNEHSSRSHTIFRIIIESRERGENYQSSVVTVSHLNIVDLAGSERTAQTGAVGERLKEGCSINKSLLALTQVISQLSDHAKFVNFRDSRLTRILQNSLGGNAKTAIICNVTPAVVGETESTLRFACRAKDVENKPVINEVMSDEAVLRRCRKQITELQDQIQAMRSNQGVDILMQEKNQLARLLEEKEREIKRLNNYICHSSSMEQTEPTTTKAPQRYQRRETWAPGLDAFRNRLLIAFSPRPLRKMDLKLQTVSEDSVLSTPEKSMESANESECVEDEGTVSEIERLRAENEVLRELVENGVSSPIKSEYDLLQQRFNEMTEENLELKRRLGEKDAISSVPHLDLDESQPVDTENQQNNQKLCLDAELKDLQLKIDLQRSILTDLDAKILAASEEFSRIHTEIAAQEERLQTLRNENNTYEADLAERKASLEGMKAEIDHSRDELQSMESKAVQLQSVFEEKEATIVLLKDEISSLESTKTGLEVSNASAVEDLQKISVQILEAKNSLTSLAAEKTAIESQMDFLKCERENMLQEVSKLKEELQMPNRTVTLEDDPDRSHHSIVSGNETMPISQDISINFPVVKKIDEDNAEKMRQRDELAAEVNELIAKKSTFAAELEAMEAKKGTFVSQQNEIAKIRLEWEQLNSALEKLNLEMVVLKEENAEFKLHQHQSQKSPQSTNNCSQSMTPSPSMRTPKRDPHERCPIGQLIDITPLLRSAKKVRSALASVKQSRRRTLSPVSEEIESVDDEMNSNGKQKKIDELTSEVEQLLLDNDEFEKKFKNLEREYEEMRHSYEALRKQCYVLEDEMEDMKRFREIELSVAQTEVRDAAEKSIQLEKKLDLMEKEKADFEWMHDEEKRKHLQTKQQVMKLQGELEIMRSELEAAKAEQERQATAKASMTYASIEVQTDEAFVVPSVPDKVKPSLDLSSQTQEIDTFEDPSVQENLEALIANKEALEMELHEILAQKDSTEQELNELHLQKQQLLNEVQSLTVEAGHLKEALEASETQLNSLSTEVEAKGLQLMDLLQADRDISGKQTELSDLQEKCENLTSQTTALEATVSQLQAEIGQLSSQKCELLEVVESQNQNFIELQVKIDQSDRLSKNLDAKIKELGESRTSLEQVCRELVACKIETNEALDDLKNEVQRLKAEKTELANEISGLNDRKRRVSIDVNKLRRKSDALMISPAVQDQNKLALTEERNQICAELEELESKKATIEENLERIQALYEKAEHQYQNLMTEIDSAKSIRLLCSQLEAEKDSAEAELAELKMSICSQLEELTANSKKLAASKIEFENVSAALASKETKVEMLRNECDTAVEERMRLQCEISLLRKLEKDLHQECADLRSRAANLQQTVEKLLGDEKMTNDRLVLLKDEEKEANGRLTLLKDEEKLASAHMASLRDEEKIANGRLASLKDEEKAVSAHLTALQNEQEMANGRLISLKDEEKAANGRLAGLQNEILNTETKLVELLDDVGKSDQLIADAELATQERDAIRIEIQKIQDEISVLNSEKQTLENSVDLLKEKMQSLQEKESASNEKMQKLTETFGATENDLEAKREFKTQLEFEIAGMEEEKLNLKKEIQELSENFSQKKPKSAESQNSTTEFEELKSKVANLSKELASVRDQLTRKDRQLKSLEEEKEQLEEENTNVVKDVRELSDKRSELESEMKNLALQQKTISAEKRDLETKLAQKEAKIRELHNELRSMSERLAEETTKLMQQQRQNPPLANVSNNGIVDTARVQFLERENAQLHNQLQQIQRELSESIAGGGKRRTRRITAEQNSQTEPIDESAMRKSRGSSRGSRSRITSDSRSLSTAVERDAARDSKVMPTAANLQAETPKPGKENLKPTQSNVEVNNLVDAPGDCKNQ